MLVVTRRGSEAVVIELPTRERVSMAVVRIRANQVRLGVKAPQHLPLVREELVKESADDQ
ncbi:MAG: carbon storage regulator [Gammaproteobacteria bacterium]|jgi:carbon storage regulator CsrA